MEFPDRNSLTIEGLMHELNEPQCPECQEPDGAALDRRAFIRVAGGVAALAATSGSLASARAARLEKAKAAEVLIQELHANLSAEQKQKVVLAFDHAAKGGKPARLGMYNGPAMNQKIGQVYSKAQQELIEKILKSMVSGEDGYRCISRNGTWDASGALENCGCDFFGAPVPGKKYAWLFSGHHMTLRADGDFQDGNAWGGPVYYGHSPNGYSDKNIFNFQTKKVLEVFKALDGAQREKAVVRGSPGEQADSVRFRKPGAAKPGIAGKDLSSDQRSLVEKVMRDLLAPYRKEDGDEVMQILKANGDLDNLHLAFYRDKDADDNERWHFWRLEGPGFIWNYRVLPHVHCYVNIGNTVV